MVDRCQEFKAGNHTKPALAKQKAQPGTTYSMQALSMIKTISFNAKYSHCDQCRQAFELSPNQPRGSFLIFLALILLQGIRWNI